MQRAKHAGSRSLRGRFLSVAHSRTAAEARICSFPHSPCAQARKAQARQSTERRIVEFLESSHTPNNRQVHQSTQETRPRVAFIPWSLFFRVRNRGSIKKSN